MPESGSDRMTELMREDLGAAVWWLTPVECASALARWALLRLHALRAAEALQRAAALVLAEHDPRSLPFVTLDDQLAQAAEREGFAVLG